MRRSPPLRFLAVVLGGWAALRAVFIAPPWSTPPAGAAAAPSGARALPRPERQGAHVPAGPDASPARIVPAPMPLRRGAAPIRPRRTAAALLLAPPPGSIPQATPGAASVPSARAAHPFLPPKLDSRAAGPRRWSLSAWAFVRGCGAPPLAAAGLLGGSQAGARFTYRLNGDPARPLAVSVRLSGPLRTGSGAEAAVGLDWQPVGRIPVHLLAERRQALGRDARSAFGVTAFGGVSDARLGRLRIDAYAQAGLVGTRSRDLFADGSIRLSLPVAAGLRAGAGAWAAAQPGVSRLDLGPQAAFRLPVAGHAVTISADWRLRIAGNADPGSGPALTVATDF
ncbi:MAG TPA: hypothetical protein VF535_04100 [Allosphingosinicella sp.]|jgi:hypothetical protein